MRGGAPSRMVHCWQMTLQVEKGMLWPKTFSFQAQYTRPIHCGLPRFHRQYYSLTKSSKAERMGSLSFFRQYLTVFDDVRKCLRNDLMRHLRFANTSVKEDDCISTILKPRFMIR